MVRIDSYSSYYVSLLLCQSLNQFFSVCVRTNNTLYMDITMKQLLINIRIVCVYICSDIPVPYLFASVSVVQSLEGQLMLFLPSA